MQLQNSLNNMNISNGFFSGSVNANFSSTSTSGKFWSDNSFMSLVSKELAKDPMQSFSAHSTNQNSKNDLETNYSASENTERIDKNCQNDFANASASTNDSKVAKNAEHDGAEKDLQHSEVDAKVVSENAQDVSAEKVVSKNSKKLNTKNISDKGSNDISSADVQKLKKNNSKNTNTKEIETNVVANTEAANIAQKQNQIDVQEQEQIDGVETVAISQNANIRATSNGNAGTVSASSSVETKNVDGKESAFESFIENASAVAKEKHETLSAQTKNENGAKNSKKENRNAKINNEAKIAVTDLRTNITAENKNVNSTNTNSTVKIASSEFANTVDMTMNLAQNAEQNILSQNTQTSSAYGSDFHAMIKNQIVQNASEFVKAGSIVLKDGNSGTINLMLNPERLGNVKISLELTDKLIAGHIIVDSRETYEAFRESAANLKQAFVASGFEMGDFDVAWSGAGTENEFAQNSQNGANEFAASQVYGEYVSVDSSDGFDTDEMASNIIDYDNYAVNVIA